SRAGSGRPRTYPATPSSDPTRRNQPAPIRPPQRTPLGPYGAPRFSGSGLVEVLADFVEQSRLDGGVGRDALGFAPAVASLVLAAARMRDPAQGVQGLGSEGVLGRQRDRPHLEGVAVVALGAFEIALALVHGTEVEQRAPQRGVHRSEGALPDPERRGVLRERAVDVAEVEQQRAEIVGGLRHLGVVATEDALAQRQCTLVILPGLFVVTRGLRQAAQVVEGAG